MVENDKLVFQAATGSVSQTPINTVNGRTYKVIFTVSDRTAGSVEFNFAGTSTVYGTNRSTNGTFTQVITTTSNNHRFNLYASGFTGKVDNVVVQELKHDATNLMLNAGAYQSANPLITSTKSMEFDGSDNYLQLSEPFSYTNHTITGWFKFTNETTDRSIFEARDGSSDGIMIYMAPDEKVNYLINNFAINSGSVLTDR